VGRNFKLRQQIAQVLHEPGLDLALDVHEQRVAAELAFEPLVERLRVARIVPRR
jgi:hypothetical protein